MFDLQELKVRANYVGEIATQEERMQSFVGIKRNSQNNTLEFCLPKGFEKFPTDNFDSLKKIFFRTYKTYRKFFEEKKLLSDNKSFDGFSEFKDGFKLVSKDDNIATYSKLSVFDSILDAYNELQILTLQSKLSRSSEIDYARIEKYLHRGIYLEDDAVFIDEMEIPKKIIDLDSPTLIQMFCYIYGEIKSALEENIESHRTKSLAQEFKEKYLSENSSLFDKETFTETLTILKDTLDDINKFTAYKDEDYWHFYEAIYTFLYGENEFDDSEDGTIWGLDNFSFVWEELCYNYAVTEEFKQEKIVFADKFGRFITQNGFKNPFTISINAKHPRYIRPDLVVVDESPTDWKTSLVEYLNEFQSSDNQQLDELADFTFSFLKEVFNLEKIEIHHLNNDYVNLRLNPKYQNHTFSDIWEIYQSFVDKNPKVIREPLQDYFRNVAHIHKREFIETILMKITGFKLEHLINRKPFIFDFTIIDYKYVAEQLFKSINLIPQRKHDIKKQLVYEMALQSGYETRKTKSEFWIPGYFTIAEGEEPKIWEEVENLNYELNNNEIVVVKLNFEHLQEIYLQQ
jgi:hypothetical protein